MSPRLVFAIVSTILEVVLIGVAVIWGLPKLDIEIPIWIMIVVMVLWVAYSVYTYMKGTRALQVGNLIGLQNMIGTRGKVVSGLCPEGLVRIRGELWSARSVSGEIEAGKNIIVTGQHRLKLEVRDESISPDE